MTIESSAAESDGGAGMTVGAESQVDSNGFARLAGAGDRITSIMTRQPRSGRVRCEWARGNDPLMTAYHDREWGVPVHDDRKLFEFLILEGAQAGLSWSTVLNKRERYRQVFAAFDPAEVARFRPARLERLLADPGIIRNRLKVQSAVRNAKAALAVQGEFGSLDAYLWSFVEGRPRVNRWRSLAEIPATTEESDVLSKDLKRRGFNFVGSTICYAFMQAVGMVNDHTIDCFRYRELR